MKTVWQVRVLSTNDVIDTFDDYADAVTVCDDFSHGWEPAVIVEVRE